MSNLIKRLPKHPIILQNFDKHFDYRYFYIEVLYTYASLP